MPLTAQFQQSLDYHTLSVIPRNETQWKCSIFVNIDCVFSRLYCAHFFRVLYTFFGCWYNVEVKTICYVVQYAVHKELCSTNLFFWISCCLLVLFSIKFYWRCRVGWYYLISVDIQTHVPINQSLKDRRNIQRNTTYLWPKCRSPVWPFAPQFDRKAAEEKLIPTPCLGLLICRSSLVRVQASDGWAKCLRLARHLKQAMRLAETVPIKTLLLLGH